MFALTTLVYPCLLAGLCLGCGLLIDRLSGRVLPGALLAPVGGALLIAVSQLMTYDSSLAPATPTAMVALALLGYAVEAPRLRRALPAMRPGDPALWLPVLVYGVALAPVLVAGRPSFSAFGLLTDSAFHMMGADYLIRHGQQYGGLDLANSYGQYISSYYGTSYPSGADTLFGGSAFVLGLPLIWAFQPFNAFMLALASGPILLLARRIGLSGALLVVATLTASVPALVYGYELIASVKELTALPLVLTLGALVATGERWLRGPPARRRGVRAGRRRRAFRARDRLCRLDRRDRRRPRRHRLERPRARLPTRRANAAARAARCAGHRRGGATDGAPPVRLTGGRADDLDHRQRRQPARGAADCAGGRNLAYRPLHELAERARRRVDRRGDRTYRRRCASRRGAPAATRQALARLVACRDAGARHRPDARRDRLGRCEDADAELADRDAARLGGRRGAERQPRAARARGSRSRSPSPAACSSPTPCSTTRPTSRRPPATTSWRRSTRASPVVARRCSSTFDEYSLYVLRDLDVGGPDFLFPPPALAELTGHHHGYPVDLDAIPPRQLVAYPLIVTRVNPAASRPPSAYRLLWQGSYYQVWGRLRARPAGPLPPRPPRRPPGCLPAHRARRAGSPLIHGGDDSSRRPSHASSACR